MFVFWLDVRIIRVMMKVYFGEPLVRKLELLRETEKKIDSN
jgi:hypothetical protein